VSSLESIFKERRSATKFLPEAVISREELQDIFNLVKYSPSCFNLQHARFHVVIDKEKIRAFHDRASQQYKLLTASAIVVVLGDKLAYQNVGAIYEGLKHLGFYSEEEYQGVISMVTSFYEGNGESFRHDEAIRNASLSAMSFMLAAKDRGWDTCPMIGFDPAATKEFFGFSDTLVPVLLIAVGKEDLSARGPRGYRKPLGEYVTFE
jgi:putative NAD(P)H nitroreductase